MRNSNNISVERKGLPRSREEAGKIEGNEAITCPGSRRKGEEWSGASKSAKGSSKMRTGRVC